MNKKITQETVTGTSILISNNSKTAYYQNLNYKTNSFSGDNLLSSVSYSVTLANGDKLYSNAQGYGNDSIDDYMLSNILDSNGTAFTAQDGNYPTEQVGTTNLIIIYEFATPKTITEVKALIPNRELNISYTFTDCIIETAKSTDLSYTAQGSLSGHNSSTPNSVGTLSLSRNNTNINYVKYTFSNSTYTTRIGVGEILIYGTVDADSLWYLLQNFGTSDFVNTGSDPVNTTYYSNSLSYNHAVVGTPDTSYLGWTKVYYPGGDQYQGQLNYFTYTDRFRFWGGGNDILGYEIDVSNFKKVKLKIGNFYPDNIAIRVLDDSNNLVQEDIFTGKGVRVEEYNTESATKLQILEGWNNLKTSIAELYWILVQPQYSVSSTYKYLGFYTTSIADWPTLMELIINYTGGSISNGSTQNIGASATTINNAFHYAYGITKYNSTDGQLSQMFDAITGQYTNGARFTFTANGENKFYFYIELETPIPDVTDFTYWSGGAGGADTRYAFMNLSIYGTNTNPATMGGDGSDMNNLSNWTLLSNNFTKNRYGVAYPT